MENQEPLHKHEWGFDAVPNEQLIECCYYEYGRESAWLRQANLELVQAGGGTGFGFLHPTSDPMPWQSLSETVKGQLKRLGKSPNGVSPVKLARWREAQAICKACRAKLPRTLTVKRVNTGQKLSRGTSEAAQPPTTPFGYDAAPRLQKKHGTELVLFEIDWTQFSDGEIARGFERWLRSNRPSELREPERRGPAHTPWRARLERLGIMRLLHHHRFRELVAVLPKEYRMRTKYSDQSGCGSERAAARQDFHRLLPFVPKEEDPLSWSMKQKARV